MAIESAIPATTLVSANQEVRLDASGRLDQDISCRRCGYNLRGQLPDGRCPECATPMGRSLQGDFLRFCDPIWVKKLSSGMGWIVATILLGILYGIVLSIVIGVTRRSVVPLTLLPVNGVFAAIALYAYWLLTTPDPGRQESEDGITARKLVRIVQVTQFALMPLLWWLQFHAVTIYSVLGTISGLFGITGTSSSFIYAGQLAQRIPDEKLARSCRIVMWGLTGTTLLSISVGIFFSSAVPMAPTSAPAASSAPLPPPVVAPATAATGCVLGLLSFVFGIWTLLLINRFRKAFKLAAQQATATWAAAPAGVSAAEHTR